MNRTLTALRLLRPSAARPRHVFGAHGWKRLVWAGGLTCAVLSAHATIYSCVDPSGNRHTSDRPIPECLDTEQHVLNADGSQRQLVPPRMNAEERAAQEDRLHQAQLVRDAQRDAARRDRNLMLRFPDEATHRRAREAALNDVNRSIDTLQRRVKELEEERRPLLTQTEFYKGRSLPHELKTKLDGNEAQQQAQRDLIQTQQSELVRINAIYDVELERLRKLWAGATPGSLGPAPGTKAASGVPVGAHP